MNDRRQSFLPSALALMLAFALAGCASMQQRVTESENRSNTLEAQVADLQAMQQEIINRLSALRTDLEAALDPIRAQQAGGGADLRALQAEVTAMQEQVQLLTAALAQAQAAAAGPSTRTPATGGGQTVTPPPPTGGTDPVASSGTDEDNLFAGAYADYTAGQFVVAVSGFEEFIARYPGSPRAADAIYWIGESLAAQDRHADARARFQEIPQRYPDNAKIPDALLRAALEAVQLGQINEAIRELNELIAAHAGTDAASIGCFQLDRLGQTLPPGCQPPVP